MLNGNVAAGQPVLAEQNVEDTVSIDRYFVGNHEELFGLRVKAATESIDNPRMINGLRRDIARILTEQRRREIEGSTES